MAERYRTIPHLPIMVGPVDDFAFYVDGGGGSSQPNGEGVLFFIFSVRVSMAEAGKNLDREYWV